MSKTNKLTDAQLLDSAITLLTEWCLAIENNGSGWDDWDDYYKDASYRPGPLRELIDKKKEELANRENYALGMDRFY